MKGMELNSQLRDLFEANRVTRIGNRLGGEQYPAEVWPDDFECPDNLRADVEAVLKDDA